MAKWTQGREEKLKQMWAAGMEPGVIAAALGISAGAVRRKACRLELEPRTKPEVNDFTQQLDDKYHKECAQFVSQALGVPLHVLDPELRNRDRESVVARAFLVHVLRNRDWSYPRIARAMRTDHSSIIYLFRRLYKYCRTWPGLAEIARAYLLGDFPDGPATPQVIDIEQLTKTLSVPLPPTSSSAASAKKCTDRNDANVPVDSAPDRYRAIEALERSLVISTREAVGLKARAGALGVSIHEDVADLQLELKEQHGYSTKASKTMARDHFAMIALRAQRTAEDAFDKAEAAREGL